MRNLKAERGVEPSRFLRATVVGGARTALLREQVPIVAGLARLQPLEVVESLAERPKQALPLVGGFEAYIPAADLFDVIKERARLGSEIARTKQLITHSEGCSAVPGSSSARRPKSWRPSERSSPRTAISASELQALLAALGDA